MGGVRDDERTVGGERAGVDDRCGDGKCRDQGDGPEFPGRHSGTASGIRAPRMPVAAANPDTTAPTNSRTSAASSGEDTDAIAWPI